MLYYIINVLITLTFITNKLLRSAVVAIAAADPPTPPRRSFAPDNPRAEIERQ